jgi:hypothetical protein
MIIFGLRASNIGSLKTESSQCEYCGNKGTQNITEFGRYFHFFWIPIFPLGRKTFVECLHCKRTIKKKAFDSELKKLYTENKSTIRRPLWHWSGLILFGLLITLIFILAKIN